MSEKVTLDILAVLRVRCCTNKYTVVYVIMKVKVDPNGQIL